MNARLAIMEKLKKIPFFQHIKGNDSFLDKVLSIIRIRKYKKDSFIIKEGQIGSELFIVYRGEVEIKKRTRAGDSYTVVILNAAKNVFFGEMCLIDDEKRSATVIARQDSIFLVIKKEDFIKLGNSHPQICLPITREISKILSSRLRKTTQDMLTIFDALVNEIQV